MVRSFIIDIYTLLTYHSRGFKALKQSTKLLYLRLHRPTDALKTYTELLTYTKSAVTRNYSEKTINGILDYVGGSGTKSKGVASADVDVLERFYEATKVALVEAKNEVGCYGWKPRDGC
jgi:COP9 signalosome complex subunit 2